MELSVTASAIRSTGQGQGRCERGPRALPFDLGTPAEQRISRSARHRYKPPQARDDRYRLETGSGTAARIEREKTFAGDSSLDFSRWWTSEERQGRTRRMRRMIYISFGPAGSRSSFVTPRSTFLTTKTAGQVRERSRHRGGRSRLLYSRYVLTDKSGAEEEKKLRAGLETPRRALADRGGCVHPDAGAEDLIFQDTKRVSENARRRLRPRSKDRALRRSGCRFGEDLVRRSPQRRRSRLPC